MAVQLEVAVAGEVVVVPIDPFDYEHAVMKQVSGLAPPTVPMRFAGKDIRLR